MLREGLAEVALAGATDSMLNPLGLGGFSLLRVLSDENENPQDLQSVKVIVENAEMDGWYSSWLEHVGSL